ncbi:hypothetical protein ASPFODRAFT_54235, partial [Aspergillus luchuensis CBS 106.47]
MHHRASEIARLVTAWGEDLATMRQPSDNWTKPKSGNPGIREPGGSETGKSSDRTTVLALVMSLMIVTSGVVFPRWCLLVIC